jgi:hypothetical protein
MGELSVNEVELTKEVLDWLKEISGIIWGCFYGRISQKNAKERLENILEQILQKLAISKEV